MNVRTWLQSEWNGEGGPFSSDSDLQKAVWPSWAQAIFKLLLSWWSPWTYSKSVVTYVMNRYILLLNLFPQFALFSVLTGLNQTVRAGVTIWKSFSKSYSLLGLFWQLERGGMQFLLFLLWEEPMCIATAFWTRKGSSELHSSLKVSEKISVAR